MSSDSALQFYLARVEQARREAEVATLNHVRERCRRSEAAWSKLADGALRHQQLQLAEQERKATRKAPAETYSWP